MTGKHKRPPVSFRPGEGQENWLREFATATGQSVNDLLRQSVRLLQAAAGKPGSE